MTTTTWKNPVPVAVTDTVKTTSAPLNGTLVGFAVLETLIVYVGGAAVAKPTALRTSIPALNRARDPSPYLHPYACSLMVEPGHVALMVRNRPVMGGP